MANLVSVRLETVLVSVQERCTVCTKRTIGLEIILVCSMTVLVSGQDSCMVCAKCTIGLEIILDAPDGTLSWRGSSFRLFGDSANLDALCWTYHRLKNHFGRTQWNPLVAWVMSNLVLVHSKIELASIQDRCLVCSNIPSGHKSFWMHSMVLLGDEALVKAHFSPFGDNVNLNSR
jgi:hypothetical protein